MVEELWHLEPHRRLAGLEGIALAAYDLLSPLLPVTDAIVRRALALDAGRLGANDRIHLATCEAEGIETILSADVAFEGAPGLRRIDPLSQEQVGALLTENGHQ